MKYWGKVYTKNYSLCKIQIYLDIQYFIWQSYSKLRTCIFFNLKKKKEREKKSQSNECVW